MHDFDKSIDENALNLYLRFNYIPCPYSIYSSAKKLFPGHYLVVKNNDIKINCYYDIYNEFASREKINIPEESLVNDLDKALQKSVRERMEADVPVGAFLSGGIDSSLMSALMQSQCNKPIKTFTVGFDKSQWDESKYAENIAKHLCTDHTTIYISPETILESVESIFDIYDEPFGDASALSTYCLAKIFRKYVTVAIGGDGGDELFTGYHRHKLVPKLNKLSNFVPKFIQMLAQKLNKRFLSQKNPILSGKIKKATNSLCGENFLETYINSVTYWPTATILEKTWFKLNNSLPLNAEQVMFCDMRTFLHDDVLCKVDRASMAVSLETRAPFLDYDLIDFAISIPIEQKFRNGDKKYLLKKVLNRYVPKKLWDRPKIGFGMPLAEAFRTSLRHTFDTYLKNDTILWQHIKKSDVESLWQQHISGKINNESLLWNIFVAQQFLLKKM